MQSHAKIHVTEEEFVKMAPDCLASLLFSRQKSDL